MAAKVSVKYVGHLPAVEVDLDGLGEQTIVRDEPIEVSANIAASLLEQVNNWQLVSAAPASAPAPVKTPTRAEEAK